MYNVIAATVALGLLATTASATTADVDDQTLLSPTDVEIESFFVIEPVLLQNDSFQAFDYLLPTQTITSTPYTSYEVYTFDPFLPPLQYTEIEIFDPFVPDEQPAPVPLPAGMMLLLTGLAGLGLTHRMSS